MTDPGTTLCRWEPPVADSISTVDLTPSGPVAAHPIIVEEEFDPPIAQTLVHALGRAGIPNVLCAPDPKLEAERWYRELPRLIGVRPTATINGRQYRLEEIPQRPIGAIRDQRPERIAIDLDLHLKGRPYPGFGSIIGFETDLLLINPVDSWIGEVRALVTPDTNLAAHGLTEILRYAYFSPSDSFEAGPWDRQLEEFLFHAEHIAHRTLADDDTAIRESLTHALKNELLWLIPNGRPVDITIDQRGRVDVRIGTPSPETLP